MFFYACFLTADGRRSKNRYCKREARCLHVTDLANRYKRKRLLRFMKKTDRHIGRNCFNVHVGEVITCMLRFSFTSRLKKLNPSLVAGCYLLFFLLSLLAGQLLLNRRDDVAGSMPPPITSPLGGHPITRLFHRTK